MKNIKRSVKLMTREKSVFGELSKRRNAFSDISIDFAVQPFSEKFTSAVWNRGVGLPGLKTKMIGDKNEEY